jgi:hypothetical protein
VRIARVRLSNWPPRCTIEWSEGKGVVGECWRSGHRQAQFVRSESTLVGCSEAEWAQAHEAVRMGLSYEEWLTTCRYAAIMAYPLQLSDKYAGCVSLDTTQDEVAQKILSQDVWSLLGDAAVAIEKALGSA